MSVQYQRMGGDDIDDDDNVVCQPGGHAHFPNGSGVSLTQALPTRQLRWPTVIGIIQIVLGTLIALLGVFEVLILPIMDDHTSTVQFNKSTCYGAAIYAGLVMVISGSLAVRASLTKRKTTVHSFYHLSVVTVLVYTVVTVVLIAAYSLNWNRDAAYPTDSSRSGVHLAVTLLVVGGMVCVVSAVVHYHHAVCFGHLNLWHWWTHCLCSACSQQSEAKTEQPFQSDATPGPVSLLV